MADDPYNFSSGLPGLDRMLHDLKPGDNVVLQVSSVEDYLPFVVPYYEDSLRTGKRLIYFRFARHDPIVPEGIGAEIHRLHPEEGFERFINEVVDIAEQAGLGACYVFDCLSDLAVDWYSDRMLGNFFMVACPYLYRLDTIAYFALLRNHHSSVAIDAITNTAQVVMTIWGNRDVLYIQPQKVWQRYSPTMYMLHAWQGDDFVPVTCSATTAEIMTETPHPWLNFTIHRPGVWQRAFLQAKEALADLAAGREPTCDLDALRDRIMRMAVTRDDQFAALVRTYLPLARMVQIVQHMIGTGLIGGKTLGMLLARAILEQADPVWEDKLEPHDSFFIGSDVFYTFLVQNDCWWLRRKPKTHPLDRLLANAADARHRLLAGEFPKDIEHQFMEMLNYFGQSPIIVRSSSLLEDNYGNAFSGKYDSVFCANQGTPEQRLEEFKDAVRTVYASTVSREALIYRADRGLLGEDEQMALLVQRVSGAMYGRMYFPQIAGVGFSFNPYVWSREIDPASGLLRIVFGLGTRAVDRSEDDYTRLVSLSAPLKRPQGGSDDRGRYLQRYADVLDLEENMLLTRDVDGALQALPAALLPRVASQSREVQRYARERGLADVFAWQVDFDALFRSTPFVDDMRALLRILEDAYDYPVDVEFTANFVNEQDYQINLVQCRPFQVKVEVSGAQAQVPDVAQQQDVVLQSQGPIIGPGVAVAVDRLVYIVPEEYSRLSIQDRYLIARLVGRITHVAGEAAADTILLIGPGRWGTRSPSLGVPVTFSEINRSTALCELAVMHEGLIPDVSLGTHFFNDLVEMEMIYLAVFPDRAGNVFLANTVMVAPNRLGELLPDAAPYAHIVRVVNGADLAPARQLYLRADPMHQTASCYVAQCQGPE